MFLLYFNIVKKSLNDSIMSQKTIVKFPQNLHSYWYGLR